MSGDVVIRAAVAQDDPELVFDVLWQLAPDDVRPHADRLATAWRDLHAQAGRRLLLAVAGDTFVGTLDTVVVPNLTHGARPYMVVENVVVTSGWRRRGVARALMLAALDEATAAGCYKVQLVSNATRTDAHRFYASLGFAQSALGYRRYLTTTT
ncbi:GNAT family N-acetyltransferase [Micromonospora sp. NPDC047644]|uniref:GNAT family N-acetyltransferase n=1 Tax=Micromonospora sp. NPDC047644 TaxID=3157203 RepID=UPI003453B431